MEPISEIPRIYAIFRPVKSLSPLSILKQMLNKNQILIILYCLGSIKHSGCNYLANQILNNYLQNLLMEQNIYMFFGFVSQIFCYCYSLFHMRVSLCFIHENLVGTIGVLFIAIWSNWGWVWRWIWYITYWKLYYIRLLANGCDILFNDFNISIILLVCIMSCRSKYLCCLDLNHA